MLQPFKEVDVLERVKAPGKPSGMKRAFFRTPIHLYHWGLGFLMGGRFLLLEHKGRKTGRQRATVLEVVDHDEQTNSYTIASGFGHNSDWYRNVLAEPEVTVQVRNRTWPARAKPLSPQESGEAMVRYSKRYPRAARGIARLMGFRVDGTEEDYRTLGRDEIPFVVLEPRMG